MYRVIIFVLVTFVIMVIESRCIHTLSQYYKCGPAFAGVTFSCIGLYAILILSITKMYSIHSFNLDQIKGIVWCVRGHCLCPCYFHHLLNLLVSTLSPSTTTLGPAFAGRDFFMHRAVCTLHTQHHRVEDKVQGRHEQGRQRRW